MLLTPPVALVKCNIPPAPVTVLDVLRGRAPRLHYRPPPPPPCPHHHQRAARTHHPRRHVHTPSHWRLSAYPRPTRSSLASNPASCSSHRSNNIATPPARRILAHSYIRCTSERTNRFCSSPAYSRTAYRWHFTTRAGAPNFITRLLTTHGMS